MAGNSIRCLGKFLYDNDMVKKENMKIETASGIKELKLFTRNGLVSSVTVNMGSAEFNPSLIPVALDGENIINRKAVFGGKDYNITCVSVGNPHCVVFVDNVDKTDIETVGPQFESSRLFPEYGIR